MTDLHVRNEQSDAEPGVPPEAARTLMKAAFLPTGLAVGIIVVVMLAVLITGGGDFAGAFAAVGAGWLALHQVSLPISGVRLGVLPLLATAAIFAATYRQCRKVVRDGIAPHDAAQLAAAVVGVPVVMTIIALAIVKDASTVLKISTPNFFQAFAWTIAVHGLAVVIALGRTFWKPYLARIPDWSWEALRSASRGAVVLLAAGLAVVLVMLAASLEDVVMMLDAHGGSAAPLGLTLLSVLYVANVVVGVVGVSTGAAVTIGDGYLSLFEYVPAPVPSVPILAVLPTSGAAPWWPVLFLVPLTAGIAIARSAHSSAGCARESFFVAAAAALVVSVGYAVLAVASGGALGVFGTVAFAPALGALFLCGWLLLGSGGALGIIVWRENRKLRHSRREEVERAIAEALAEEEAQKSAEEEAADQVTTEDPQEADPPSETKRGVLRLFRQKVPQVRISVKSIPGTVSTLPAKVRRAVSRDGDTAQKDEASAATSPEADPAEAEVPEGEKPEGEKPEGEKPEAEEPEAAETTTAAQAAAPQKSAKWKVWKRGKNS